MADIRASGCGLTHPCGDGYGKSPLYWLTLAYAGGCPGRFDVGCQVPMRFNFAIPAQAGDGITPVLIGPVQPNQPVALVANVGSTAVTIARILGPDEKDVGMEGTGISGADYLIADFSSAALNGTGVNPFPLNVGLISKTNPIRFDVVETPAVATVFRGVLYGFVPGLRGVREAVTRGHMTNGEAPFYSQIAQWCESGDCPPALLERLKAAAHMGNALS